jgi:hypothetical protein
VEAQLWVDGLLCAYEFVPGPKKHIKLSGKLDSHVPGLFKGSFDAEVAVKSTDVALGELESEGEIGGKTDSDRDLCSDLHQDALAQKEDEQDLQRQQQQQHQQQQQQHQQQQQKQAAEKRKMKSSSHHWVAIGWSRLEELVGSVEIDADWLWGDEIYSSQQQQQASELEYASVADVAIPYWEPKSGPTWWCNVLAGHPRVEAWLSHSHNWLHPAVSGALRDESRLISERMKHLFYEVKIATTAFGPMLHPKMNLFCRSSFDFGVSC